ncbi:sensor histidine kinase [Aliikangiella sp. IMCC44653]
MSQSNNTVFAYIAFWGLVFLLDLGPHWENYTSTREIIETIVPQVVVQMAIALLALKWLIPNFLNKNRKFLFLIIMFLLLFIGTELLIFIRYLYLEPTYPDTYRRFLELYGHFTFQERTLSLWAFKYIFYTKYPLLLYPSAILIAFSFYTNQRKLLQLSEQKKQAELSALKNQLNPHFIFNTLNNLYALALTKSDLTPVVIEKLSDILDYMLYRCGDEYVSLLREVQLVENYVALEKIRYGSRLVFNLKLQIESELSIAPLILLNLIENACKHSTGEELDTATIDMSIETEQQFINITISNTVPNIQATEKTNKKSIGLDNLHRQLELLYPNRHKFIINREDKLFSISLTLETLIK